MRQGLYRAGVVSTVVAAAVTLSCVAGAQKPPGPPLPIEGIETFMIRQDSSDCNNSTVNANNPALIGGTAYVLRQSNGSTQIKIAISGTPNTTYVLYHKCVGQIGTITTQDEGEGTGLFTFQTNPGIVTFDMYPNGAPAGNKFQSVPITVR